MLSRTVNATLVLVLVSSNEGCKLDYLGPWSKQEVSKAEARYTGEDGLYRALVDGWEPFGVPADHTGRWWLRSHPNVFSAATWQNYDAYGEDDVTSSNS